MIIPIRRRLYQGGFGPHSHGASAPVPTGQAIDTTSGYYTKVNSTALVGQYSTGFYIWALVYIPSGYTNPAGSEIIACHRGSSGTRGWNMRLQSTGVIDFYAADSFPTYIFSGSYKITAADHGKYHLITGVANGTANNVRTYFDATDCGVGGTWSSYSAPTTGDALTVGALSGGGNALTKLRVVAFGGATGAVPTEAQVAAHYNAILAAEASVACGVGTERWWSVDSNPTADATWTDETAAASLDKSGTVTVSDPTFAMDAIDLSVKSLNITASVFRGDAGTRSTMAAGSGTTTIYGVGYVPSYMSGAASWPSGNDFVVNRGTTTVTRGFAIRLLNSGSAYLCYEQADGTGTLRRTPLSGNAALAQYAGKRVTWAATHNGSTINLYINGAKIASGTTCTGATAASDSPLDHTWLLGPSSLFNEDFWVVAIGATSSVCADDATIAAWHTTTAAATAPAAMGLTGELFWSTGQLTTSGDWSNTTSSNTWVEQAGTVDRVWVRRRYA